jgi:hypothetical protein
MQEEQEDVALICQAAAAVTASDGLKFQQSHTSGSRAIDTTLSSGRLDSLDGLTANSWVDVSAPRSKIFPRLYFISAVRSRQNHKL